VLRLVPELEWLVPLAWVLAACHALLDEAGIAPASSSGPLTLPERVALALAGARAQVAALVAGQQALDAAGVPRWHAGRTLDLAERVAWLARRAGAPRVRARRAAWVWGERLVARRG
jgi:hypothetical protein